MHALLSNPFISIFSCICISGKDVGHATHTLSSKEWDGWAHKVSLTHLSLVCSSAPCALSIAIVHLLNDTLLACFYFIFLLYKVFLSFFFRILLQNYNLCFNDSPCYNVGYYKYLQNVCHLSRTFAKFYRKLRL